MKIPDLILKDFKKEDSNTITLPVRECDYFAHVIYHSSNDYIPINLINLKTPSPGVTASNDSSLLGYMTPSYTGMGSIEVSVLVSGNTDKSATETILTDLYKNQFSNGLLNLSREKWDLFVTPFSYIETLFPANSPDIWNKLKEYLKSKPLIDTIGSAVDTIGSAVEKGLDTFFSVYFAGGYKSSKEISSKREEFENDHAASTEFVGVSPYGTLYKNCFITKLSSSINLSSNNFSVYNATITYESYEELK